MRRETSRSNYTSHVRGLLEGHIIDAEPVRRKGGFLSTMEGVSTMVAVLR